jgi:hypothetical protein
MKNKLTLIVALAGVLTITSSEMIIAQTSKGSWLAEGNIGNLSFVNSTNSNSHESKARDFDISLNPRMGYLLTDHLVIGTTLNFTYGNSSSTYFFWDNWAKSSTNTSNTSVIGLIPFLRYYIPGKNANNRFYGQVGAGAGNSVYYKGENTQFSENGEIVGIGKYTAKEHIIFAEALVGYNHFFTNTIAFNTALGYTYNKNRYNSENHTTSYGVPSDFKTVNVNTKGGIVWSLGFTIIIPNKKVE